jgi:hypothetical protein
MKTNPYPRLYSETEWKHFLKSSTNTDGTLDMTGIPPPDYWRWEDKIHMALGLIYIWADPRMSAPEHRWVDPPKLTNEFRQWLKAHDVKTTIEKTGNNEFIFPNDEAYTAFKLKYL